MKKRTVWLSIIIFLVALPLTSMANSTRCATKYPVVLAHGMGFHAKIAGIIDYWGTIPGTLKVNGAKVYVTDVNAADSTEDKAIQWKTQVRQILAVSGKEKVNVIGHSHGAIYPRYAITNLGLSSKVASLTSIAGPHRGSVLADMIMGIIPSSLVTSLGPVVDRVVSFFQGDINGSLVDNGYALVRSNMTNVFNPNTPDMPGIIYQSYAYKITNALGSGIMLPTWQLILPFEGDNDGLVAVTSAKWGNFKGVITGIPMFGGVNHQTAIGVLPIPGYDPPSFFTNVVADLKSNGL